MNATATPLTHTPERMLDLVLRYYFEGPIWYVNAVHRLELLLRGRHPMRLELRDTSDYGGILWMYDVVHDQWFQLTKKKLRWRDVPNYGMAC